MASEDLQQTLITVVGVTWGLALLTVALRFVSRRISRQKLNWDDWLILAAVFTECAIMAIAVAAALLGLGRSLSTVSDAALEQIMIYAMVSEVLFGIHILLVKASVLAFYLRIFWVTSIKKPVFVLGVVSVLWTIAFIIGSIFQCNPPEKLWKPKENGVCINKYGFFVGTGVPEIMTDFAILILPLPYIWGMKVQANQKALVLVTFLLGSLTLVTSILRVTAFATRDFQSQDFTISILNSAVWSAVEVNLIIVSACLPVMRPLITYVRTGSGVSVKATGQATLVQNTKSTYASASTPSRMEKTLSAFSFDGTGSLMSPSVFGGTKVLRPSALYGVSTFQTAGAATWLPDRSNFGH